MIEVAAALEATALAQHLKASRWTYPLVNAGHILGVALLVGAVVPLDLSLLRGRTDALWLRLHAAAGLTLAVVCGVMLFVTQATEYVLSGWFAAKMALLAIALANVAAQPRLARLTPLRRRAAAAASLAAWPGILVLGRLVAYG